MKNTVIDLCCGKGGWAAGFLAEGFQVIGFDIHHFKDYPGQLILQDVRTIDGYRLTGATCIVASPPCQDYSIARPSNHRPDWRPDTSIWQACARIAADARAPLILENVHWAQRWHGPATHHYGKFFLWGNGVPALLPQGPHWKDKQKTIHRSPALRSLIPLELAKAIARHHKNTRK